MDYEIYADTTLINTIVASEDFVIKYCSEHGYGYRLRGSDSDIIYPSGNEPDEIPLTFYQQSLIDEYNQIQSKIDALISEHYWADTAVTFTLAMRQYNALIELLAVLHDRIEYEGILSHITQQ